MKKIKRGDIFYADLRPVIGSEQGGVRPVLVIQNDVGNQYSRTIIVAAITTQKKGLLPTHVKLLRQLKRQSVVMLEQIRTIDHERLIKYVGHLDDITMQAINHAISISFGLPLSN